MDKYVTVVSVDDQLLTAVNTRRTNGAGTLEQHTVELISNMNATAKQQHVGSGTMDESQDDSQFVTVLSINHGGDGGRTSEGQQNAPEVVLVYRLPGERLGFGLKFQGGTKSNEKIQRLFIQSCAENSPASRVQASWGHLREGDEILEIDGVNVSRMTRIECVKCLKDSTVAIKLLVRNGEGKVQNFYGESGTGAELPERKGAPPPPPPVPPRKLNKRKQTTKHGSGVFPPTVAPVESYVPPPDPETYSNLFADDISDLISESDDTASTISTVVDKFSICSSLSSEDYTIPSHGGPAGIGPSAELAKALKPFTLLEQEFNLESKFETTNLFTFKPPPSSSVSNVVQLEVPAAEKPSTPGGLAGPAGEYENVTIMKVDENRNYENVAVPYGPYENVTIQTVQPYENMVLSSRSANPSGVYENVDVKTPVPPRPLPRQGAVVEPKKRAPIPVPIPIVVPPPRLKPTKQVTGDPQPPVEDAIVSAAPPVVTAPLGGEFNTIQNWLQEATEVIHECALTTVENGGEEAGVASEEVKVAEAKHQPPPAPPPQSGDLPRLIDFHPKVSVPLKALEEMEAIAPPASPVAAVSMVGGRFDEEQGVSDDPEDTIEALMGSGSRFELPPPEAVVRKCIKILSSEDHTYIESSSSDEDDDKMYRRGRSEDEDDRSSLLSRDATTPEQFLSGDGFSDEDGEKLGPPEIVSGGPSEAYFNFPWTSNLLPPIGEVEEEFSSLEHQHNGPIVIINTADETVINDTNNNQQREKKKPIDDEFTKRAHVAVPSTKIVIKANAGQLFEATGLSSSVSQSIEMPIGSNEHQIIDDQEDDAVDSDDSLEREDVVRRPVSLLPTRVQESRQSETMPVDNVNNNPADKVDAILASGESPMGITCPDGASVADSTQPADVPRQEQEVHEVPATIEHSPTMSDSGESVAKVSDRTADGELAKASETIEDGGELDDSNIDAICGDVDIVVGDTVESDFEELVKAQVEPIDVEDSSEQIQQIHERIIVGIERAVSDVSDGEVLLTGDELTPKPMAKDDDAPPAEVPVDACVESDLTVETVTFPEVPAASVPEHQELADDGKKKSIDMEEKLIANHTTEQGMSPKID
ncbi:uncharacterized protein LOC128726632 [Anopheles nili]|uniref:uncharacterized protein LOC128726632 n=1 Tax=Anopheles nili TaxID=185578 RepID=UPI00237BBA0A|nr:uncharacterized protein LOC128726632 [Anopheles nili]